MIPGKKNQVGLPGRVEESDIQGKVDPKIEYKFSLDKDLLKKLYG